MYISAESGNLPMVMRAVIIISVMTSLCIAILASVKEGNLYVNKMNYNCTIFGLKQLRGQKYEGSRKIREDLPLFFLGENHVRRR